MISENDRIKLIFAFKAKYLRQKKNLSYKELANATGLSTSYLHDIENGKKYPKYDKINVLASALDVDYNYMVSTVASKRLQPIIDLLNSDLLKIFPIELFGLDYYKIFDLFANTPDKINAFISTIIKITRYYQLGNKEFFIAALRSYQDMHDNYFEDLEQAAASFKKESHVKWNLPYTNTFLESVLANNYGIRINRKLLSKNKSLADIRSYFIAKEKTLLLNKNLSTAQENFILGRELAFQYLQITDRRPETRVIKADSFEQMLNNFRASYFSVAVLMNELELAEDFRNLAQSKRFEEKKLMKMITKYNVTPEMLMQRLTNILPHHFGIKDLFFTRIEGAPDLKTFSMTKELHLSQLHHPYANLLGEHYCHRWISVNVIKQLRAILKGDKTIADAQISSYWETPNSYLCLTFAKESRTNPKVGISVTLGLLVNDELKKTIQFLDDQKMKRKVVHTTCERCSIPDCDARVAPPSIVEQMQKEVETEMELEHFERLYRSK